MTLGVSHRQTVGESRDDDIADEGVPLSLGNCSARTLEAKEESRVDALCTWQCQTWWRSRTRRRDNRSRAHSHSHHNGTDDRPHAPHCHTRPLGTENALPEGIQSHATERAIGMPSSPVPASEEEVAMIK